MASEVTQKEPTIVVVPDPSPRTEYVTRTIHEHRAPTDQSVALLRDMEAAVERKIEQSIHIGNTAIECVVHISKDMLADCTRLKAIFKLNGQTETAEHSFRPRERGDELQASAALRDEVAKVIASKMIASAFGALYR